MNIPIICIKCKTLYDDYYSHKLECGELQKQNTRKKAKEQYLNKDTNETGDIILNSE